MMSMSAESEDVLTSRDCSLTAVFDVSEQRDEQTSVQGLSTETVGQSTSLSNKPEQINMKSVNNMKKEKSSLLHTKSYLMNSLLHLQDRSRILLQLSKQNDLDSQSRNIYHGKVYNYVLPAPRTVWTCSTQSRSGRNMSEMLDRQDVLADKVLYLATLLRVSSKTVLYTGAGLSTSAGVRQRAPGSTTGGRSLTTNARPSTSHLLLAELVRSGLVHTWVTLCCDGLAQKAGCPQERLLEVHGSWYDPTNPVLRQGGTVRPDVRERLTQLEETADLVLVMGSSLTGDHPLVSTTSRRAGQGESLGSVIVNLQQTGQDPGASLRLFSHTDKVSALLASRLGVKITKPDIKRTIQHRAWVTYDAEGERTEPEGGMWLDLSPGQEVRLNPHHNCQGSGQDSLAHIGGGETVREGGRLVKRCRGVGRVLRYCPTQRAWEMEVEGVKMLLGYWWLETCTSPTGPPRLPVVNCKPKYK